MSETTLVASYHKSVIFIPTNLRENRIFASELALAGQGWRF